MTCLLWFGAVLMPFPMLYRIHDYYLYAIARLPITAISVELTSLNRFRHLARIIPVAVLAVSALQLYTYRQVYAFNQSVVSNGGHSLTSLIKDLLPEDEVIILLGTDWSAAPAYYADRRAFVLRETIALDIESAKPLLEIIAD
ncbi:MAG: hypothetical protein J6386_08680 [Candidatus Synoicihabitans palmerolidicus]|nr:hypothetical protein [Candidatus Synoicihabitans palmerolidicus]